MIQQVAFACQKLASQFFHPNISQSQMFSKTKEEENYRGKVVHCFSHVTNQHENYKG